jgi:hypothetical protein
MALVQFNYEISADEYAAGQLLFHKSKPQRRRFLIAAFWILLSILLIAVALRQKTPDIAALLLFAVGIWWIYRVLKSFFLSRYFRSAYTGSEVAGETYRAAVDESGFEVEGKTCAWRVAWPGVIFKGEDERVFAFVSNGTLFIFGKRHLNSEQQQGIRRLGSLPTD